MKRGLKDAEYIDHSNYHNVTILAPMKRGLKDTGKIKPATKGVIRTKLQSLPR